MLSGAVKQQIGNVSLPRPPSAIQEQPLLRSQCTPPGLQKMLLWWLQLFLTASLILTTHAVSKGLIKLDPPHCFLQSTAGGALSSGTADELRHAKSPGSAPVYFPYMSSPLPSNLLIPKWLLSQPRAEIWMTSTTAQSFGPAFITFGAAARAMWNSHFVQHGTALPFEKEWSKPWGLRPHHLLSASLQKPEQLRVIPHCWWLKERKQNQSLQLLWAGMMPFSGPRCIGVLICQ